MKTFKHVQNLLVKLDKAEISFKNGDIDSATFTNIVESINKDFKEFVNKL